MSQNMANPPMLPNLPVFIYSSENFLISNFFKPTDLPILLHIHISKASNLPSIVHVAAARWLEIDRKLRMYFSLQIHVDLAAAPESFIVLLGKSKRPPSPGTAWDYLRCLLSLHATKAQRLFHSRHSGIDKLWDVLDSPMFGELPDTRITAGEGRGVNRGVAVTSLLPIRSIYHPTSWNQWKAKRRKARKLQRLKKIKKSNPKIC